MWVMIIMVVSEKRLQCICKERVEYPEVRRGRERRSALFPSDHAPTGCGVSNVSNENGECCSLGETTFFWGIALRGIDTE